MFIDIIEKSLCHIQLTFLALFLSIIIAVPLGMALACMSSQRWSGAILRILTVLQTIPGLALMALTIVLLVFLHPILPLPTTGLLPSTIVLSVYAVIPICHATYTGLSNVSPSMKEIADGIGMTSRQKLVMVEFPLALPVIIAGVRIAIVWTIGLVALTSLIGSGGLGDFILRGLRLMDVHLVLAGTLPAAVLAVLVDWSLLRLEAWLLPRERFNL